MMRFSMLVVMMASATVLGQSTPESLKGPDRIAFQDLKGLKNPVIVAGDDKATASNRALLVKQAKFYVGQLKDPKRFKDNDLARAIEEMVSELPIPRERPIESKNMDKYLAFGRELGDALVPELESALKNDKVVVRVNAARMLNVAAELGCDKVAGLALATIAKPDESEGVKHWALRALYSLFAIEPDSANKDKSVFAHFHSENLERDSIVALCDYITKPRDVANMEPGEVTGITMIRREAVKALGMVRTPRLKFEDKVLARPALVLLKVANKDGIVPEPDMVERVEAIIGFCQLFPVVNRNADREVQCDFAAHALASALLDVVTVKINDQSNISIPWRFTAMRMDAAMLTWAKNVDEMRLNATRPAAMALHKQAKADLLDLLKNERGERPNTLGFRNWLQSNMPKSKELFKDEPGAMLRLIPN